MKQILSILLISFTVVLLSCSGNSELKKDAVKIADAMCKSMETLNQLKAANPADSAKIDKLQAQSSVNDTEMSKLYEDFQKKYKDKLNDKAFTDEFSNELRKAMLDCKYLSKEDRETFEKEIK